MSKYFRRTASLFTAIIMQIAIPNYTPKDYGIHIADFNILTFMPTTTPQGNKQDVFTICNNIKKQKKVSNKNTHTIINKKAFNLSCELPTNYTKTIIIYCTGYAGISGQTPYQYDGNGAYSVYRLYKTEFLNSDTPCISFDMPSDDANFFNFGQQFDQECLHTLYQHITNQNPNAKIVFIGLCKGATTILNYINNPQYTHCLQQLHAVVLESPSSSLTPLMNNVAKNRKSIGWFLPALFKARFKRYIWNAPNILDGPVHIPSHISLLIGYMPHDIVSDYHDSRAIYKCIKKNGNSVEKYEVDDTIITHGKMAKDSGYKKRVHSFLKTHNLVNS